MRCFAEWEDGMSRFRLSSSGCWLVLSAVIDNFYMEGEERRGERKGELSNRSLTKHQCSTQIRANSIACLCLSLPLPLISTMVKVLSGGVVLGGHLGHVLFCLFVFVVPVGVTKPA